MDKTGYLDALTAYSRNPSQEIPPILEQYLNGVAKNGETLFHWPLLKPLIFGKMEQVIEELRKGLSSENIPERPNVENVSFDVMHARIVDTLHKFNGAPFTIQRLCELLIDPRKHYKRSDKFLRGLEKNVLVVSTVDPFGRKVVSEPGGKHMVNGLDTNGSLLFPRDSSITSSLPPVPDWVTIAAPVSTQSVPATDLSDHNQTQPSSQDSTVSTNDGSGCVEYGDQGEHPLAVQTEEVIDKTVVTMDTSIHAGKDAVVEEEEDESLGGDDTSTSSSSSSSSELSTSDAGESSDGATTTVVSAGDAQMSPWVFVNSGESNRHASPSDADSSSSTGSTDEKLEQVQEAPLSQRQSDSLPSQQPLETENNEQSNLHNQSAIADSSSDVASVQQDSFSDSMGPDTEVTQEPIDKIKNDWNDPQHHVSDTEDSANIRSKKENENSFNVRSESINENASVNVSLESENDDAANNTLQLENEDKTESMKTKSEIQTDDNVNLGLKSEIQNDDLIHLRPDFDNDDSSSMKDCLHKNDGSDRPESDNTPAGIDLVLSCPVTNQTTTSTKRTYADVVASSFVQDSTPLDHITEHDTMAGLERLVDSVHPSPTSSMLSPISTISTQYSPTTTNKSPKLVSSSADFSSHSEEPQTKRQKLSDETSSHLSSKTSSITSSSEAESLSPNDTSAGSDLLADTTSDTVAANPTDTTWDLSSEAHESMDAVSCSGNDVEDDGHTHEIRDDVPSPPSSSDSQGFDVTSGALHRVSSEEKQVEESVMQETQPQEVDDGPSVVSQGGSLPEDMPPQ